MLTQTEVDCPRKLDGQETCLSFSAWLLYGSNHAVRFLSAAAPELTPQPSQRLSTLNGWNPVSDADRTHFWSLSGHDTFEGSDFPIGSFPSEEEARGYALEWLREKDRLSSGSDGGQVRGGMQDRVYLIHHREGRSERIFPPMHPVPIYLSQRSLLPDRVVLRHADARSALDFFGRSMWCVVTAVRGWLLYEDRARFWRREPRLERAEEYDGTMHTYEMRVGQPDTRSIVRESATRAHDELTRAYERWRRSPEAAHTELCFEIVAQDDIPLKEVVAEVEELLGVELEPE